MKIFAQTALLPSGWAEDVLIKVLSDGRIGSVHVGTKASSQATKVRVLVPAPVNAHSHGFQRAMAGLTERRGPAGTDSFWTWRRLMYRFLNQLTPDHIEAITAFVQMEMLEAGYATSVEFHYLHNQPGGAPYDALSEMSERVAAAADCSGIGLTLLPVMYQYGGCDQRDLGPGQIRFRNDLSQMTFLMDGARRALQALPADTTLGLAPHSLRAVSRSDLVQLPELLPKGPLHMHLAEQQAEVAEVQSNWGARPVEWALENMELDKRWCLIHCTQMQRHETQLLARTGAVAGLCPMTEANLGDGIFDGVQWLNEGGHVAIGSDSNIRISLSEELRMLDYSQRLRDHSRAALASEVHSTGRRLFDAIVAGGARAAGRKTGEIAAGHWADLMSLDGDHIELYGRTGDQILDSYIFAGSDALVRDVWSAGRHLVTNGRHSARSQIEAAYRETLTQLTDRL
ncbi:MAG: formimidoylglutamate deiminase [Pseudoruegeria sp.]